MFARRMRFNATLFLVILALVLSACELMIEPTPDVQVTQDAVYTAAAQTIMAQLTETSTPLPAATSTPAATPARIEPPTVTVSPLPQATATAQPTAAPTTTTGPAATATPEPAAEAQAAATSTPTATAAVPLISAWMDTNCRNGPGPQYKIVGYLFVGQQTEVQARDRTGWWWYIQNPAKPERFCWVWAETTQVSGDAAAIPVFSSLATQATPVPFGPDFSIESANLTACVGMPAAAFGVENFGNARFESASLLLEDLTSQVTLLEIASSDAPFRDGIRSCPPGESALALESIRFVGGPLEVPARRGHLARVTIELCTQDGLNGDCVQRAAEFVLP